MSYRNQAATMAAALVAFGFLSACGDDNSECTAPTDVEPAWMRTLGCQRDFDVLATERSDAVFSRTRTINWLIDREDENRTYFIDSDRFELHFFFASSYLVREGLTPVGTHAEFNLLNYRRQNRRFLLGKLVRYVDQELTTIEMSAGDTADADMIIAAYEILSQQIFNGAELRYRPVSAHQESMLPEIAASIPVVATEDVFLGQDLQPLNPAVGFGTLRFAKVSELAGRPLLPTEIIVLDRVPNDISMVSGVITAEFQTPLSHINILSKNRGTPNMALRGAFDNAELRALNGKLVRLEVGNQEFTVAPAEPAEAQAFWDSLRPATDLVPALDLSVVDIVNLADVGASSATSIGSKAANLAELARIDIAGVRLQLPETPLAIPFARYAEHLQRNGLWDAVDALLADAAQLDPEALRERLFDLRWRIYRAPIDPALVAEISAAIAQRWPQSQRLRFRSSTNAEDLAEFSGAGLYTSAGASADQGDAAIGNAIKVVWASTWSYAAFVERDFQRVQHRLVHMGVLVHAAFAKELANGVAITINQFNGRRPAYYINSQIGEVSVTNPTGRAIPEQILYYTWYEEPEYEVITRSSLLGSVPNWPGQQAVLTDAELQLLASYLERIHVHFNALIPGPAVAMDVEYKLAPGRVIYIKQARPLRIRTP